MHPWEVAFRKEPGLRGECRHGPGVRDGQVVVRVRPLQERTAVQAQRLADPPLGLLDQPVHLVGRHVDEPGGEVGEEGLELEAPAVREVDEHDAALGAGCLRGGLEAHEPRGARGRPQRHLAAGLRVRVGARGLEDGLDDGVGVRREESLEGGPHHRGARFPQEGGAGEVQAADAPGPVERQIRYRGLVVERGVPGQRRLAGLARLAEFLVLQLQLHLVNLELVEEPLGVGGGAGRGGTRRRGAQACFRAAAQRGGLGRRVRARRLGRGPWSVWRPCGGRAALCTGHRGVSLWVPVPSG